jgi:hypothetical protein
VLVKVLKDKGDDMFLKIVDVSFQACMGAIGINFVPMVISLVCPM